MKIDSKKYIQTIVLQLKDKMTSILLSKGLFPLNGILIALTDILTNIVHMQNQQKIYKRPIFFSISVIYSELVFL